MLTQPIFSDNVYASSSYRFSRLTQSGLNFCINPWLHASMTCGLELDINATLQILDKNKINT
jgi:hypothetical protein